MIWTSVETFGLFLNRYQLILMKIDKTFLVNYILIYAGFAFQTNKNFIDRQTGGCY